MDETNSGKVRIAFCVSILLTYPRRSIVFRFILKLVLVTLQSTLAAGTLGLSLTRGLGDGLNGLRQMWMRVRTVVGYQTARGLEALEGRAMLATFTVTNVSDSGVGSFREAVLQANATAGAYNCLRNSMAQALRRSLSCRLCQQSRIPCLSMERLRSCIYTADRNRRRWGATAASGIRLTSGSSTLRGLAINNFQLNAVLLASNGNRIEGSFIGLGTNGSTPAPNLLDGVLITGSNNVIGGPTSATANVISGNGRNGIAISGPTANNNIIEGNTIGLDLFKTTRLPTCKRVSRSAAEPSRIRSAASLSLSAISSRATRFRCANRRNWDQLQYSPKRYRH